MLEDAEASSGCPSGKCNVKVKKGLEHREHYTDSSTGVDPSLTDNLSTIKAIRIDLESNPGRRTKKLITNLLSDGTN